MTERIDTQQRPNIAETNYFVGESVVLQNVQPIVAKMAIENEGSLLLTGLAGTPAEGHTLGTAARELNNNRAFDDRDGISIQGKVAAFERDGVPELFIPYISGGLPERYTNGRTAADMHSVTIPISRKDFGTILTPEEEHRARVASSSNSSANQSTDLPDLPWTRHFVGSLEDSTDTPYDVPMYVGGLPHGLVDPMPRTQQPPQPVGEQQVAASQQPYSHDELLRTFQAAINDVRAQAAAPQVLPIPPTYIVQAPQPLAPQAHYPYPPNQQSTQYPYSPNQQPSQHAYPPAEQRRPSTRVKLNPEDLRAAPVVRSGNGPRRQPQIVQREGRSLERQPAPGKEDRMYKFVRIGAIAVVAVLGAGALVGLRGGYSGMPAFLGGSHNTGPLLVPRASAEEIDLGTYGIKSVALVRTRYGKSGSRAGGYFPSKDAVKPVDQGQFSVTLDSSVRVTAKANIDSLVDVVRGDDGKSEVQIDPSAITLNEKFVSYGYEAPADSANSAKSFKFMPGSVDKSLFKDFQVGGLALRNVSKSKSAAVAQACKDNTTYDVNDFKAGILADTHADKAGRVRIFNACQRAAHYAIDATQASEINTQFASKNAVSVVDAEAQLANIDILEHIAEPGHSETDKNVPTLGERFTEETIKKIKEIVLQEAASQHISSDQISFTVDSKHDRPSSFNHYANSQGWKVEAVDGGIQVNNQPYIVSGYQNAVVNEWSAKDLKKN